MIGDVELVPVPERGRRFTTERRVRWGDADEHRRLRLDAVARYLQDVANDDTRDAGHDPMAPWVVRRTVIDVRRPLALGELVTVTTFSGGHGSRWAERRTVLVGDAGGHVEAAALWVFVDPATGRPAKLTAAFHATYDEAAGGRQVQARLRHGPPPDGAERRPWPLRSTDVDGLGHVNNAATWSAVEDELARHGLVATYAELEHPDAIEPGSQVALVSERTTADPAEPDDSTGDPDRPGAAHGLRLWLEVDG
ncbi:MAG TPA: acyl-ACP thioesterase domain-containing protein, partial [Aquihabitans sp.]|nr:acyl-ACP thioesterase domain-containing protein [Aquihabitans sp.]